MKKNQNCGTCKFFFKLKGNIFPHGCLNLSEGTCQRFPPNQSQKKYQSGQGDFWPLVISDSWCGEYKFKKS